MLRLTGSASQIVYEALPVDDPQVRQPDITRAQQLLGWEPEIELEDGLRAHARLARQGTGTLRRPPARRRRGPLRRGGRALAPTARRRRASCGRDLRRRRGPLRQPRPTSSRCSRRLNTQTVRVNLWWGGRPDRRRRPQAGQPDATRPIRPTTGTRTTAGARARPRHRVSRSIFSIIGTPTVGERGQGLERRADARPSTCGASPSPLRARYDGTFRRADGNAAAAGCVLARLERAQQPGLPQAAVRAAAQRPLGDRRAPTRLRPRSATRSSGGSSRSPVGAEGRLRRHRRRAATTSRARSAPRSRRSRSCAAMKAAGATGFDAYAHHPYYGAPTETPSHAAAARRGAARRRPRSRSATSTCS